MTDHDPKMSDDEGRDLAAAEMALGLRAASTEDRESPLFLAWERRLLPMLADVASVEPDRRVWAAIVERLDRQYPLAERPGLWRSIGFWRSFGIGSAALAAASLVALFGPFDVPFRRAAPQQLVAVLGPSNVSSLFTAVYDPARGAVTVAPIAGAIQDARVPELWYIPAGSAPRSLGVFDPTQRVQIELPQPINSRFRAQDALAISLEPPGGSPTGAPTGPVVALGNIRPL